MRRGLVLAAAVLLVVAELAMGYLIAWGSWWLWEHSTLGGF